VSKNSWKVNPTKIEEWNMAPVIADGRLKKVCKLLISYPAIILAKDSQMKWLAGIGKYLKRAPRTFSSAMVSKGSSSCIVRLHSRLSRGTFP